MSTRPSVIVTVTLATLMVVSAAAAQDEGPPRRTAPTSGTTAWFGLPLPPKPGSIPAVVAGTRGPRPVTLPPGEPAAPEFQGATIRKDLEQLIAHRQREPGEQGDRRRPDLGPHRRLPVGREDGGVVGRAIQARRHCRREDPADHPGRQRVVLAAALVGGQAPRRCGARRRHAATSCSSRRCRSRRATFPAARSPRRWSTSATAARRCSSTSTSRARSRCSSSSRRRTWCSSATRWCRRRRRSSSAARSPCSI